MRRLLIASCLMFAATAGLAGQAVWLDDLDLRLSEMGGEPVQNRRSLNGNPLRLGGKEFAHGIGVRPPAAFTFALAGGSTRFTAAVGNDDEAKDRGTIEFKIEADGKLVWQSGVLRGGDAPKTIDVPLAGVKMMKLIVTDAGDGTGGDHADLADARFEFTDKRPEPFRPAPSSPFDIAQREVAQMRGQLKGLLPQTFRRDALILEADRDAVDVVLRRTSALLARLKTMAGVRDLSPEEARLSELKSEADRVDPKDRQAREGLFERATALRRRIAFANPLLNFDRILFIKKHFYPPSEGLGNHMCDQFFGFMAMPGGGLFVLENPFSDRPTARDLLADAVCGNGRFEGKRIDSKGGFLSPELSYDGKSILFAWTEGEPTRYRWSPKSTYHLFRVNADGSGLVQLTDGAWNDMHPAWLPNGRICFISERRGGFGRCHGRPVPSYTLHSMNPDGSDIVCVSYHETNEWYPSVNHDGMVVYTRWDYVDRGFNQAHHPWVTTPDGRDARAVHGNFAKSQGDRPLMEMSVRSIPGSRRYAATAAAHHGQAYGSLVIIGPEALDDDKMNPVKRLTPEVRFPEAEGGEVVYATPWPLSEEFYLCVYDPLGAVRRGPQNNFGIYLVDAFGNRELLYRDSAISCLSPIPFRPRPTPPVLPHMTLVGKPQPALAAQSPPKIATPVIAATPATAAGAKNPPNELTTGPGGNPPGGGRPDLASQPTGGATTAPVGLINVYDGLFPWPEGTRIVALRVVQVLPKSTPAANSPRIGHGSQKNARAVLGTVPVEEDGSAYFRLPVGKPVFLQALDKDGFAVQSMRSDLYVQPGETLICQGCHDPRPERRSLGRSPIAMRRPASQIQPDVEGSNPFSYPRLVQPVLDRYCVDCHAKGAKPVQASAGSSPLPPGEGRVRDARAGAAPSLKGTLPEGEGDALSELRGKPAVGAALVAAQPAGPAKAPDLAAGDWRKNPNQWYTSYINLGKQAFFYTNDGWETPRTIPGKFGARASRLYALLAKGHYDVKLPPDDLHRLTLWLDCNSDFFGAYENTLEQAEGKIVRPSME